MQDIFIPNGQATVIYQTMKRLYKVFHVKWTSVLLVTMTLVIFPVHYTGVYQYMFQVPFSQFSYPLEVDMRDVVRNVKNQIHPAYPEINPMKFKYMITSASKCKSRGVQLVFAVKSAVQNIKQRTDVRRTWGNENRFPGIKIITVFFLGVKSDKPELQAQIAQEQEQYNDLVQQDFEDAYYNNTHKTISAFNWVRQYCSIAEYVMFLDDDIFVSTQNLQKYLHSLDPSKPIFTGFKWNSSVPIRFRGSKWYMALNEYPYGKWPPYLTAGAYLVSMNYVQDMCIAMRYTQLHRFDDIYVGIVAWKLKIYLEHNPRFVFYSQSYQAQLPNIIATHGSDGYKNGELVDIWAQLAEKSEV